MTIEPEEYVTLNQPEHETPSTVSYVQDNYENIKLKIISIAFNICAVLLILLDISQLWVGCLMFKNCDEDKYTPLYFLVAGLVGFPTVVSHLIVRRIKKYILLQRILYPFYIFQFCWLIVGTHYYVGTLKEREGCLPKTYSVSYWLILTNYICLTTFVIAFCWALTIVFSLVYFKNKIVQFLARSVRF